MLTDDRLRELWANGFTITVMVGPFIANFARSVEREARREALEEAAKVCDDRRGPIEIYNHGYPAMLDCAAAIRSLANEKP